MKMWKRAYWVLLAMAAAAFGSSFGAASLEIAGGWHA